MLESISGSFEFHAAQEYSLPAQEFWALWKNSDARKFLVILEFYAARNFQDLIKVDESFHFFSQNIFGHSGNSLTLQKN